jgi:hypothetical protein
MMTFARHAEAGDAYYLNVTGMGFDEECLHEGCDREEKEELYNGAAYNHEVITEDSSDLTDGEEAREVAYAVPLNVLGQGWSLIHECGRPLTCALMERAFKDMGKTLKKRSDGSSTCGVIRDACDRRTCQWGDGAGRADNCCEVCSMFSGGGSHGSHPIVQHNFGGSFKATLFRFDIESMTVTGPF